jgi:mannose-6-phosphate isomerase-like protein (cupin superfamily)
MRPEITKCSDCREVETAERCFILEVSSVLDDDHVSIARARVLPGITTAWHRLKRVEERYLIVSGSGRVSVQGLEPADVGPGDVVRIPAGTPQRIANTGSTDLIFYCICTPPFQGGCYEPLEPEGSEFEG